MVQGTFNAVDNAYQSSFSADLKQALYLVSQDNPYLSNISALVIGYSRRIDATGYFTEGDILGKGPASTYIEPPDTTKTVIGTESLNLEVWGKGSFTYDGSRFLPPYKMNPIWTSYSIKKLDSTMDTTGQLVGYNLRTPANPMVGEFYAPMTVPDQVGRYQIEWAYQKDNSSFVTKVVQPFVVNSRGINAVLN